MMRSLQLPLLAAVLPLWLAVVLPANAERLRYMDEAGNIHFVDRMKEVPREYREQIVPPTPTPVLNERQRQELMRRKREEQTRREGELRRKQMDEQRRQRAAEEERQRYERERLKSSGLNKVQRGGR